MSNAHLNSQKAQGRSVQAGAQTKVWVQVSVIAGRAVPIKPLRSKKF